MKNYIFRKGLVVGIIFLFVGTGVVSANNSNVESINVNNEIGKLNPDIETFNPSDDTTIYCNGPYNNDGSSPTMDVRNMYGQWDPWYPGNWQRDSLIKFDISSIPSGSMIYSAKLKLYYYDWWDNNPAGRKLKLYRATSNWEEGTVTWNTQPSWAFLTTTYARVPVSTGVWMQWNVKNDVRDFVDGQKTNYGWKVTDEKYWGHSNIPITYFRTKEYEDENYHPYLEIKFTKSRSRDITNPLFLQLLEQFPLLTRLLSFTKMV